MKQEKSIEHTKKKQYTTARKGTKTIEKSCGLSPEYFADVADTVETPCGLICVRLLYPVSISSEVHQ